MKKLKEAAYMIPWLVDLYMKPVLRDPYIQITSQRPSHHKAIQNLAYDHRQVANLKNSEWIPRKQQDSYFAFQVNTHQ